MKLDSYTANTLYIKKESRYLGYRPFYNRFIKLDSCTKNRLMKLDSYAANRLDIKKELFILDIDLSIIDLLS